VTQRRRDPRRGPLRLVLLAAPGAGLLAFFFLLPLAAVSRDAFAEGLDAFRRVVTSPLFLRGLSGSLALGAIASTGSLVVGALVALHLARLPDRLRAGLVFCISLPLTFSGLIVAYGFILVYGRAGFLTQLLARLGADPAWLSGLLYSPAGLAFASSYYLVPRVVLLLLPVLLNFDTVQLTAAESLGASRRRALLDILLPQVLPTAFTAFCLIAAVVVGAYGTALALVGTRVNILPLQLYSMISETGSDFPAAAALALILLALCSSIMALGEIVAGRHERRDVQA
jgi:putative spermidine/putrescine transport system permease protein